jgi:hypothetical protein
LGIKTQAFLVASQQLETQGNTEVWSLSKEGPAMQFVSPLFWPQMPKPNPLFAAQK